jgi:cytochrome o ubiquinol oxidase operon protein cyoD
MSAPKNLGSYRSYVTGFVLSLIFTLTAYTLVEIHAHSHRLTFVPQFLIPAIVVLALVQLIVQLVFFLHLNKESNPRWNLTVLLFAIMVVGILVFGSLWIMGNINHHYDHVVPGDTSII